MMRLDSQVAKEIFSKLKKLVQEKSTFLAANVRDRVNSTVQQQAAANGAVVNAKIESARVWYEEFTGIDEVRRAQDKVVQSESRFISAQEERRKANKRLTDVDTKLRAVYGELERTRRGDDRYIFLVTQENTLMKERDALSAEFQRFEQEERENFSFLSSAVKESHEKERLQAERTKYWSIICSILGTVLGCGLSALNNHHRLKEFRSILNQAMANKENVELLVSETLSETLSRELASKASVAVPVSQGDSREILSKADLELFYNGILASIEKQQEMDSSVREGQGTVVFQVALSAGALMLLYKLFF